LQVLLVQSTRQWHDIVTLDESWIYLFSEHDLMWITPGEIVVDRERHTIQSPKFMLTCHLVVWNPIGFHVPCSESPLEGAQIQCTILYYYINDILVAISDWRRQTRGTRPNKLWLRSDNARPYTAKMSRDYTSLNRMKQAPHRPIRQIWHSRTFSFLVPSKESWWNIALTLCLTFLFVFGLFWWKSRGRHWTQFFLNEWSDCKNACR
jgi:hypothetical protein